MCLRDQGVDDNNGEVRSVRRARGLSNDDGGVGRGRVIYDASKGLETMMGAAGDRRRARVVYDDDEGVGRGK